MQIDRWISAILVAAALAATSAQVLEAQVGTVQGRVRDEEGSAVYGVTIRIMSGGTTLVAADTDRLGQFRFEFDRSGIYRLLVQGLGYAELDETVTLAAGETIELDLRVNRQAIAMEGISVEAERSRERVRFEEVGGATVREIDLADLRSLPGVIEADPIR
ncbi:MAG: hypothetical protein GWP44_02830, partial [Proteobacteria bacterium]|nr:hypothetical protein [Pseudomonadota bacterium]